MVFVTAGTRTAFWIIGTWLALTFLRTTLSQYSYLNLSFWLIQWLHLQFFIASYDFPSLSYIHHSYLLSYISYQIHLTFKVSISILTLQFDSFSLSTTIISLLTELTTSLQHLKAPQKHSPPHSKCLLFLQPERHH